MSNHNKLHNNQPTGSGRISASIGKNGVSISGTPEDLERAMPTFMKLTGWTAAIGLVATIGWYKCKAWYQRYVNKCKTDDEIRLWNTKHPKRENTVCTNPVAQPVEEPTPPRSDSRPWIDEFHSRFKMPQLPLLLEGIIAGMPKGYEDAMLMHLTAAFGAICYSRVTAKYNDGKIHSPNLGVVITAPWGTGKEKFNTVLQAVFNRVIERDRKKMRLQDEDFSKSIIQICGISTSESRFLDILANNQGVHLYMFDSEILGAVNAMRKNGGLTFEHLRKSFDSGEVVRMNRDKNAAQGSFPMRLNYTLTGTPQDVEAFIHKDRDGGTPSRIIWCPIPENGRYLPEMNLPDDQAMNYIHDCIDEAQAKYSYRHSQYGDTPVPEQRLNLDYVAAALKKWMEDEQWGIIERTQDASRKAARGRMAAIAFHAAIVFHMMWDNPEADDLETRNKVIALTLYVANYCMESFLHHFGGMPLAQTMCNAPHETVSNTVCTDTSCDYYGGFSKAQVSQMMTFYNASDKHGWKTTAKAFGYTTDADVKRVQRAIKKLRAEMALIP